MKAGGKKSSEQKSTSDIAKSLMSSVQDLMGGEKTETKEAEKQNAMSATEEAKEEVK